MGTAQVKTYQRKTKTGKVVTVKSHSMRTKEGKGKTKKVSPIIRIGKLVKKRVADTEQAESIIKKYAKSPTNMEIMVNGKWKNQIVEVWRRDKKGNRIKFKTVQRRLNFSEKDWRNFLKENGGLIHSVTKRYALNPDFWEDIKSVAIRGMFEAVNNYETKFDPNNPPDLFKYMQVQMNGLARLELTKQLATRFQYPSNKNIILTKFKQSFEEHGGDYDAIYDDLKLKRKDLYPNLDDKQGELSLPREGYVSVKKEEVLEKKTKTYENKVNKLRNDYNDEKDLLTARFHGGAKGDKEMFDEANKSFDKDIAKLKVKISTSKDGKEKSGYLDKVVEVEKNRELLAIEIKPLSEENYKKENSRVERRYKGDLKEAKDKFRKEVGKTTIQGAYELFHEFEDIMSFRDINLSKTKEFGDGESATMEAFISAPNLANPEQEMVIRSSYIKNLDRFMEGFDALEPKTAEVLKMHLGLSDKNELYAHGLWGVPMENISEIVRNLPKNFYSRMDLDDKEFEKRTKTWKSKKPQKVETVRRTAADKKKQEKALKDWNNSRKIAAKDISAALGYFRGRGSFKSTKAKKVAMVKKFGKSFAYPKTLTNTEKQNLKKFFYKLNGATMVKKPTNQRTKQRTRSDKELKSLIKIWKNNKPKMELSDDRIHRRVSRDLVLGKIALSEIVPKKVAYNLLKDYNDMIAYNISKATLKDDLRKGLAFGKILGFKITVKKKEETIITKAFNKIRSITNYLFKK